MKHVATITEFPHIFLLQTMLHGRILSDMNTTWLSLRDIAALLPGRNGKRMHVNSVRRRMKVGCRGVRLKHISNGNELFSTAEWVQEFLEKSTGGRLPSLKSGHDRAKESLATRFGIHGGKKEKNVSHGRMRRRSGAPRSVPAVLRDSYSNGEFRRDDLGEAGGQEALPSPGDR